MNAHIEAITKRPDHFDACSFCLHVTDEVESANPDPKTAQSIQVSCADLSQETLSAKIQANVMYPGGEGHLEDKTEPHIVYCPVLIQAAKGVSRMEHLPTQR